MSTAKEPIDLYAAVQVRVDSIAFFVLLRLKDISRGVCSALGEGTSASYSQGVRLNESVAIFLNWWGWGTRDTNRYSFAVFEQTGRRWCQVRSGIEDIDEAVAVAIHTLTEHALRSTKAVP